MNPTIQVLMERRSVRSYQKIQISNEDLGQIVQSALRAANAMNHQNWHFLVVQNQTVLDRISDSVRSTMLRSESPNQVERAMQGDFHCFYHAPTVVIVSGDGSIYSIANCAGAAQNMCVAATALGLGSCYIASFVQAFKATDGKKLKESLPIPSGYEPLFAVAIGYPAGELPPLKPREQKITYLR